MPDRDGRTATWGLRCALGLALAGAASVHAGLAEPSAFEQAQQRLLSGGLAEAPAVTQLLRLAAEQHDPLAEYDLAYCYEHGIGIPVDPGQALAFYQRAVADAGADDLRAIALIGAKHLMDHADHPPQGDPAGPEVIAAQLTYGTAMLRNGNVAAARLLFERAAETGNTAAIIAMGKTYDPRVLAEIDAAGLTPDPAAAANWYRRAAALGDTEGARLLGGLGAAAAQASGSEARQIR